MERSIHEALGVLWAGHEAVQVAKSITGMLGMSRYATRCLLPLHDDDTGHSRLA